MKLQAPSCIVSKEPAVAGYLAPLPHVTHNGDERRVGHSLLNLQGLGCNPICASASGNQSHFILAPLGSNQEGWGVVIRVVVMRRLPRLLAPPQTPQCAQLEKSKGRRLQRHDCAGRGLADQAHCADGRQRLCNGCSSIVRPHSSWPLKKPAAQRACL